MTFTHNLVRRSANGRRWWLLAATVGLVACSGSDQPAGPDDPNLAAVVVVPASATVAAGATYQFAAYGRTGSGDSVGVNVAYSGTGGTVSSSGMYAAGMTAGTFQVIATQSGGELKDTAEVTITPAEPAQQGWFVSQGGNATNPGSKTAPWTMAYLLGGAGGKVRPGDTVWVRGGAYSTALAGGQGENGQTSLAGSASAPLIIRAFPGERVTLDGGLTINGADTWWWGFEFTFGGWTTRRANESGSWPTDIRGPLTSVTVHGARVKIINCTVHDLGGGIESWESAMDAELYGNLIYYIGWTGPDRGHGHATYTQSNAGTRKIRDNLSWDSFSNGNNAYGSGAIDLRNVEFVGNVGWNHGSLGPEEATQFILGAGASTENMLFAENVAYDSYGAAALVRFGFDVNAVNRGFTVRDNYLVGGRPAIRLWNLTESAVTGNTTYTPASCEGCRIDVLRNIAGYTWAGNTHYGSLTAEDWGYEGSGYTWADWQSETGLGSGDTFVDGAPAGISVFVRPNEYEAGRANVTVVNWTGAGSATIDLSGIGLESDQEFEVRNAQNFYGAPVATGTGPGSVNVPLDGLGKAPIAGSSSNQPVGTGNHFNVFVVLPQ